MKFLRDRKGTGSGLVGLAVVVLAMMLFALIFDLGFLYMRKGVIRNALDVSNMAVYKEIDVGELSNGRLYIKEGPAENTFLNYLQKNLHLNDSLMPASDKSPVSGQVKIQSFEVFNPGELPATDSAGNTIDEVAVHSNIRVPLKPVFSGLFDTVDISVSITTDIPDELTVN